MILTRQGSSPPPATTTADEVALGPTAVPHVRYLPARAPRQVLTVARDADAEVVFEGLLHRRAALADSLDRPADSSDAELVVAAYARWDRDAFRRLDGTFAAILHDVRRGVLYLFRDRVGIVPLFYARAGAGWLASPSVEDLRSHPLVAADVAPETLAAHLLTGGRDMRRSFYRDVHRLVPGHLLRIEPLRREAEVERFWSPLPATGSPSWATAEEVASFPETMGRAVSDYLELGRAGIFLSGGLDSGTVATMAAPTSAEVGRERPHAFSLTLDDPEANEERVQRGVAANLGIPQTAVPLRLGADPVAAFRASLALNESWPHPLASTFQSVYQDLGRIAAATGVDLVLTGDGGDEWLALHPGVAADLLRTLSLSQLGDLIDTVRRTHGMRPLRAGRTVLWEHGAALLAMDAVAQLAARFAPTWLDARRHALVRARLPDWFAPDPAIREAILARLTVPAPAASHYERAVVHDTLQHPLTILYHEEHFETGKRIGIPILKPFYHPSIVELLTRTPPHLRAQGGRFKGLLRRFLHERHPELGFDRQRKPYATNFFSTMVLRGLQVDGLRFGGFRSLDALGVVDDSRLRPMIEDILRRGSLPDLHAAPKLLWMLMCTETWVRSRQRAGTSPLREEVTQ